MGFEGGDAQEESDFRRELDRLKEISMEQKTKEKLAIADICMCFFFSIELNCPFELTCAASFSQS